MSQNQLLFMTTWPKNLELDITAAVSEQLCWVKFCGRNGAISHGDLKKKKLNLEDGQTKQNHVWWPTRGVWWCISLQRNPFVFTSFFLWIIFAVSGMSLGCSFWVEVCSHHPIIADRCAGLLLLYLKNSNKLPSVVKSSFFVFDKEPVVGKTGRYLNFRQLSNSFYSCQTTDEHKLLSSKYHLCDNHHFRFFWIRAFVYDQFLHFLNCPPYA